MSMAAIARRSGETPRPRYRTPNSGTPTGS
jgi:hypothetical protein